MSDNSPDPYKVLGVEKGAGADEIKKKYRKLAREMHPDRGGDPEKLKTINAAYGIVGDDDKRKLYDEFGHVAFRPGFDADQARQFARFGGGGRGPDGGFDMDEILKMFTGGGAAGFGGFEGFGFGGDGSPRGGFGRRGPRRGEDLHATVRVSLAEALNGSERELHMGGRNVTVRIPKGVRTGQRLRVAGKGSPGTDGGPPGDLLMTVDVSEHTLVRIDRDDLEMQLPLTFLESLRGGQITVPTPTGTVKVKIPPRAEAGMRLRLKGRGLPKGGRDTRQGDLYLVLMPTPPKLDPDGETLEALGAAYTEDVRAELKFD
ncbi:MAG: DnaJ domain-containing protein [Proteobacteria bacterium]|nr:DnaJ domain-containing protein [Pseudomonadota bacterium]